MRLHVVPLPPAPVPRPRARQPRVSCDHAACGRHGRRPWAGLCSCRERVYDYDALAHHVPGGAPLCGGVTPAPAARLAARSRREPGARVRHGRQANDDGLLWVARTAAPVRGWGVHPALSRRQRRLPGDVWQPAWPPLLASTSQRHDEATVARAAESGGRLPRPCLRRDVRPRGRVRTIDQGHHLYRRPQAHRIHREGVRRLVPTRAFRRGAARHPGPEQGDRNAWLYRLNRLLALAVALVPDGAARPVPEPRGLPLGFFSRLCATKTRTYGTWTLGRRAATTTSTCSSCHPCTMPSLPASGRSERWRLPSTTGHARWRTTSSTESTRGTPFSPPPTLRPTRPKSARTFAYKKPYAKMLSAFLQSSRGASTSCSTPHDSPLLRNSDKRRGRSRYCTKSWSSGIVMATWACAA